VGLRRIRSGPALVTQSSVSRENGLRVDELRLIAFEISSVLIDQRLVGTRIDLREQVPGMHSLAFGEVDAHDLPLDLSTNDIGVVRNHRADTAKIDRHVMLGDCPGDDWHRGWWSGRGSRLFQWASMREVQQPAGRKHGSQ